MDISKKITELRKRKGWSQAELSKRIQVSREIIGRYERDDATPSIEIAKRIADAFSVSLDYLVGNSDEEIDTKTLSRLMEIQKLSDEKKEMIFTFLDSFINQSKIAAMF